MTQLEDQTLTILRSEELWTVAFFLSRCGLRTHPDRPHAPPSQLQVGHWHDAYDYFFEALAGGRTAKAFRNTLKNARDVFDAHLDSGRVGWRGQGSGRPPRPLDKRPGEILAYWTPRSDDELWATVQGYVHPPPTQEASDIADAPRERVATTTYRILRDTELARRVKAVHRSECQICGHTIQFPDGSRYGEAHHIRPIGKPHNGPDTMGNILCVCPNHHAELDYGIIAISFTGLRCVDSHTLDPVFIEYHNQRIHGAKKAVPSANLSGFLTPA